MPEKARPEIPPFPRRHPVRALEWRTTAEGRVVVLCPKWGTNRLGRWLSRRLVSPHCRIKLDEYGSRVWKACDGSHSVEELIETLPLRPEEAKEDLQGRLARFLRLMEQQGMIRWMEEGEPREPTQPQADA